MLANHPEDKSWDEHLNGSVKYIGRLDDFPHSDHSEVDHQHYTLRDKIKRLRGKAVGAASGLGIEQQGHRVKLDNELDGVSLVIAGFHIYCMHRLKINNKCSWRYDLFIHSRLTLLIQY